LIKWGDAAGSDKNDDADGQTGLIRRGFRIWDVILIGLSSSKSIRRRRWRSPCQQGRRDHACVPGLGHRLASSPVRTGTRTCSTAVDNRSRVCD
jgi:hypothetical protein